MNRVFNNNLCPVCGYDGLEDGTDVGEICSSCGTEFGYSDFEKTHAELRQLWINENNAQWWSQYIPMPLGWSPVSQLRNIGYACTKADFQKIYLPEPTWFIAWTGVMPISTTPVYVSRIVSAHSDVVILAASMTNPNGTGWSSNNLGSSGLTCPNF